MTDAAESPYLRDVLAAAGVFTIDAWAAHAGISESLLRQLRSGRCGLSAPVAGRLARAAKVPTALASRLLKLEWAPDAASGST